ncbi:hypothetical protein HMPREF1544_03193 [Mucor circinelloides 1006PhL]|uniref:Nucleoporin NDC1 n=1 Tax=Mucor circinelloides f. circinelloides (strain 1006PhL) TaxID=1220926 RepID=S2JJ67_MUCC1|nr:hypothetical protein HMPREF1544_03193 [Mucor circinelloides 1006PhL]
MPVSTAAAGKRAGKLYNTYTEAYLAALSKSNGRYYKYLFVVSIAFAVLFQMRFGYPAVFIDLVSWKTLLFSLVLFFTGAVISLIRNMTYTVFEPTYPSSLAEIIINWTSLDNILLFVIHSALNLFVVRYYFSWVMGEKYTHDLLLQPPGHYSGARQLNQENIFITVYCITLAFGYTVRYVAKRSNVVKINNVQQPFFEEVKTSFATVLCTSATTAINYLIVACVTYCIFKGSIYYCLARFFGLYHRVLDTPIAGYSWFSLHLFLRLIVAGTATMCTFNIANRIYDAAYSYTLPVSNQCTNQFDGLVDGLSETKINAKVAAFSELAALTTKSPEKRGEIFRAVGKELKDNAWYKIMDQCFKVMNELRTAIDIEYNGVKPVEAPVPVNKPAEPQQVRNRLEISNANIFVSTTKGLELLDDRTSTIFSDFAERVEAAPPSINTVSAYTNNVWLKVKKSQIIEMLQRLELQVGRAGYFSALYTDSVTRRIQTVFNKYQLVVWAVQSLGTLTAASVKEDPYGFVQNDLTAVINQLLGCLVEVEHYLQAPPAQYSNWLKDNNAVIEESEAVMLALREAIYQIRISFDEYLGAFQIDRKYSTKWERFLNYQE